MTRPASWLAGDGSLGANVARRALLDVGICEDPPGSNRSPEIDEYLAMVACPVGNPWCAAAVTAYFRDCGAAYPRNLGASTDEWLRWSKGLGLFTSTPSIGAAVIYGKGEDAEHIGVVVRLTPLVLNVEANTSLDGAAQREGFITTIKPVNQKWRLGYVPVVKAA